MTTLPPTPTRTQHAHTHARARARARKISTPGRPAEAPPRRHRPRPARGDGGPATGHPDSQPPQECLHSSVPVSPLLRITIFSSVSFITQESLHSSVPVSRLCLRSSVSLSMSCGTRLPDLGARIGGAFDFAPEKAGRPFGWVGAKYWSKPNILVKTRKADPNQKSKPEILVKIRQIGQNQIYWSKPDILVKT